MTLSSKEVSASDECGRGPGSGAEAPTVGGAGKLLQPCAPTASTLVGATPAAQYAASFAPWERSACGAPRPAPWERSAGGAPGEPELRAYVVRGARAGEGAGDDGPDSGRQSADCVSMSCCAPLLACCSLLPPAAAPAPASPACPCDGASGSAAAPPSASNVNVSPLAVSSSSLDPDAAGAATLGEARSWAPLSSPVAVACRRHASSAPATTPADVRLRASCRAAAARRGVLCPAAGSCAPPRAAEVARGVLAAGDPGAVSRASVTHPSRARGGGGGDGGRRLTAEPGTFHPSYTCSVSAA